LNVSAFDYSYSDQQISQFNNGFTAIFNAGKSKIRGAELEVVARPFLGTTLDFSIAYLDAKFTDFVVSGVQYAGKRPPSSPEWQINAGIEHSFPIGEVA
jgi:iron complex outermembrane receptor protein